MPHARESILKTDARKLTHLSAISTPSQASMQDSQIVLVDAGPSNEVMDRGDGELHLNIIPDELRIQWERESAKEHPKRGWGFES